MLSREAIIILRPPGSDGARLASYQSPSLTWLKGQWHVTQSTRRHGEVQRNARVSLRAAADGGGYVSEATHQRPGSAAIESTRATEAATDLRDGRASRFRQAETGRQWEVLA